MVTLYLIKYGIGYAAPTLEKETYLSSFFWNDGVKELRPGVWRIETEFGSDIWFQNLEEAKAEARGFYWDQIRHFESEIRAVDKLHA